MSPGGCPAPPAPRSVPPRGWRCRCWVPHPLSRRDVGATPAGSEAACEQGQEEEAEDRLREHMDSLLDKR